MKIAIIGGGPAGLITALIIRREIPAADISIFDRQPKAKLRKPANNHPFFIHADIGNEIGVPLKKVRVRESVVSKDDPSAWPNMYSMNTIGMLTENAMWEFDKAIRVREAWIASDLQSTLIDQLHRVDFVESPGLMIDKNRTITVGTTRDHFDFVINTIPLPNFAKMIGENNPPTMNFAPMKLFFFSGKPRSPWKAEHLNKVAQVYYCPNDDYGWTRFSNIFGSVSIEMSLWQSQKALPCDVPKALPYPYDEMLADNTSWTCIDAPGLRFIPGHEEAIDAFIYRLTFNHRIMQIGRFATWRYKRVDHIPEDAKKLVHLIKKIGV